MRMSRWCALDMRGRIPQAFDESGAMAERKILATLPMFPLAEMLANTLREEGIPAFAVVGDLDGPNKLMQADLWIEDASRLDDPDVALLIEHLLAGYIQPTRSADAPAE